MSQLARQIVIKTHHDPKPIPTRCFDWSAIDDATYDVDAPIGWGETEALAIADLLEQLADQYEEANSKHARS